MAKKGKKDYFGLPYVASVILAIIPFTAWLFGAITRLLQIPPSISKSWQASFASSALELSCGSLTSCS